MSGVPVPEVGSGNLGKTVLVALEDPEQAGVAFAIGARIAAPDGGVVRALLANAPHDRRARQAAVTQLRQVGYAIGIDTDPSLIVHGTFAEGIVNAVAEHEPSFVLVAQRRAPANPAIGTAGEAVAASIDAPVGVVIGEVDRIRNVVLIDRGSGPGDDGDPDNGDTIAIELARRIGGKNVTVRATGDSTSFGDLAAGQLCIARTTSLQAALASDPPKGAALLISVEPTPQPDHDPALLSVREARM
jgi:hypothetical protein